MFRTVALVLAVSGFCLCSSVRADEAEDKAVAFVQKLGGKVTRAAYGPGKPVVAVGLRQTQVTNAGLKELTARDLSLTQVTDAAVKELRKVLPKCKVGK
jgi:hypothetical protein